LGQQPLSLVSVGPDGAPGVGYYALRGTFEDMVSELEELS